MRRSAILLPYILLSHQHHHHHPPRHRRRRRRLLDRCSRWTGWVGAHSGCQRESPRWPLYHRYRLYCGRCHFHWPSISTSTVGFCVGLVRPVTGPLAGAIRGCPPRPPGFPPGALPCHVMSPAHVRDTRAFAAAVVGFDAGDAARRCRRQGDAVASWSLRAAAKTLSRKMGPSTNVPRSRLPAALRWLLPGLCCVPSAMRSWRGQLTTGRVAHRPPFPTSG